MRRLLLAALVVMCGTTTAQADILIAPSEADNPGFRAALSTALGGETVDYFDARLRNSNPGPAPRLPGRVYMG